MQNTAVKLGLHLMSCVCTLCLLCVGHTQLCAHELQLRMSLLLVGHSLLLRAVLAQAAELAQDLSPFLQL